MNSKHKIVLANYESPSVACYAVLVEKGYSSSKRGSLEDLGESNYEGDW